MLRAFTSALRLFVLCLAFQQNAQAQTPKDSVQIWRAVTLTGQEYRGLLLADTNGIVRLRIVGHGIVSLEKSALQVFEIYQKDKQAAIEKVEQAAAEIARQTKIYDNPTPSEYGWGNSAFGLKKGEFHYQNTLLALNSVSYGITDWFSVRGGLGFVLVAAAEWVGVNFSTPFAGKKWRIGLDAGIGSLQEFSILGEGSHSYPYRYFSGHLTYGSINSNATFTVGRLADSPYFSLNYLGRVSRRYFFLTENYYFRPNDRHARLEGGGYFASAGFRYVLTGHSSLDFWGGFVFHRDLSPTTSRVWFSFHTSR